MIDLPNVPCDRDRLRRLLEDRIEVLERDELERHLEVCASCRQLLEDLAAGRRFWADVRLLEGVPSPSPDQDGPAEVDEDGPGSWVFLFDPPDSECPRAIGRLGPYDVLEILGRGGMGVVFKARDRALDRLVAIKVLAPGMSLGASARRRFAREARAAAAVSHEHIVAIHAVDEVRGFPYLVMQYVAGRSLQERLDEDGPMDVEAILRVGTQTARALAAAHAQGVVHRDIKPANILLENDLERVKLTDFGLARVADDASLTHTGVIAGTPQFMAPEQARSEAVDARVDLYALGAVLYAMAVGRPPFRAHSALAVLKRVCEDPPRPVGQLNPEVPTWLEALIGRLLAKDPADRIQTAAEVADLLEQGLAHFRDPAAKRPPELPGFPAVVPDASLLLSPLKSSRRWLLAVGLVSVLAIGVGGSEAVGLTKVREVVATILRIRTPDGVLVVKADDPGLRIQVDGETLVIGGAGVEEIRVRPGVHRIQALRGQQAVKDSFVTIQKGGREIVDIGVASDSAIKGADPSEATEAHTDLSSDSAIKGADPSEATEAHTDLSNAHRAKVNRPWVEGKPSLVWSLAFLKDRKHLAIAQEALDGTSTLKLYDLARKTDIVLAVNAEAFRSVDVSQDGRRLAAGCFDGSVLVFDLEVSPPRRILSQDVDGETINVVRFAHDGRHLISGTWEGHVRWHDLTTSKISRTVDHPSEIYALDIDPSDSIVAVAGDRGLIQLFDANSGKLLHDLKGHTGPVESLAFSPDGRQLASGSWDKSVRLWDPLSGKHLKTLGGFNREVLCVRFSPRGIHLVASEGRGDGGASDSEAFDCRIKIFDGRRGLTLHNIQAHLNSIYTLAFSPDGVLASGSMDKSVKFWSPGTGAMTNMFIPGLTSSESDSRSRPTPSGSGER